MDVAGFVDGKNKSERVRLLNGAGHTPLACRVGQPLFTSANPYCVSYCNCRSTFERETKLFDQARSGNLVI